MYIFQSAFGHYEAAGSVSDMDCAIVNCYGTSVHERSVNRKLAQFALGNAGELPIIADRTSSMAFPDIAQITHITPTSVASNMGRGDGTWGTLQHAKQYMNEHGLRKPLMIAQAHHIGRVVRQASKLGIESIVLPGLPKDFDPESSQPFTWSLAMWVPREVIGSVALRLQGKL